jgi:mannose-6-phosphate isomerase-like protein (cupin superfamily)
MHRVRANLAIASAVATLQILAADPTFLRRHVPGIQPKQVDLTTATAHYRPVFGIGDPDQEQLKGIARYGELTVDPGGRSEIVSYRSEEQIYFILEGTGVLLYDGQKYPVRRNDFMYLPVDGKHGMANSSNRPVRLLVMGFKIPEGMKVLPTPKLMLANASDVELRQLSGHGPTSQFKLLMGPTTSRPDRDKLAATYVVVEMFIMDFSPGGTNIPHHHDNAEEIYYVLRGHGDMVAGGGMDGNEGRYPSKEGDASFFRLNATVGFYSGSRPGEEHDLVLAVRSRYPFPRERNR